MTTASSHVLAWSAQVLERLWDDLAYTSWWPEKAPQGWADLLDAVYDAARACRSLDPDLAWRRIELALDAECRCQAWNPAPELLAVAHHVEALLDEVLAAEDRAA